MKSYPFFHRNENDAGGAPATTLPATSSTTPPAASQTNADLEAMLRRALDERLPRTERSVARSLQEQLGASDEDVKAALERIKAEKATQLPEAVVKRIEEATAKANAKLIAAEVKIQGVAIGLVDADAALKLWDGSRVKVTENGTVEGAKEALEALKEKSPYLFRSVTPTGQKADVGGKTDTKPPEGKEEPTSLHDALNQKYGRKNDP